MLIRHFDVHKAQKFYVGDESTVLRYSMASADYWHDRESATIVTTRLLEYVGPGAASPDADGDAMEGSDGPSSATART